MEIGATTRGSGELRQEFMTLLVAQLRNQDPLQPVQQQDFLSQLAQFSTLESIENLTGRFDSLLAAEELSTGADLIGRTVVFDSDQGEQTGVVQSVLIENGAAALDVDGQHVGLDQLVGVVP